MFTLRSYTLLTHLEFFGKACRLCLRKHPISMMERHMCLSQSTAMKGKGWL